MEPGAPSTAALAAAVAARLPSVPRLSWRLGSGAGGPEWMLAGAVDVGAHVGARVVDGPLDGRGLREVVVRLFQQHLDRDRPLWRMDVVGSLVGGRRSRCS